MKNNYEKMTRGEAAEFLGVTKNTIRNYENIGLIKPQIDTENNYRYFGVEDISKLIQIRRLRNLGFSLDEVNQFLSCTSIQELNDSMWDSVQILLDEQEELVKKIKKVSRLYSKIKSVSERTQEIQILEEKKKFYYQARNLYKLNDDQNWLHSSYVAATSGIISFNESNEFTVETGLIVKDEEKEIGFNESKANKIITFNKSVYCIKPCFMKNGEYDWNDYQPLIDFAKENHLNYESRIITYGLISLASSDKSTYFLELYLPLKDC